MSNNDTKNTNENQETIIEIWRSLPQDEKERLIFHLLPTTKIGKKAAKALPFIPNHMWKFPSPY